MHDWKCFYASLLSFRGDPLLFASLNTFFIYPLAGGHYDWQHIVRKAVLSKMISVTEVSRRLVAQSAGTALLAGIDDSGPVWSASYANFCFSSYHMKTEVQLNRPGPLALTQDIVQERTELGGGPFSRQWGQTVHFCPQVYCFLMLKEDTHG